LNALLVNSYPKGKEITMKLENNYASTQLPQSFVKQGYLLV